MNARTLLDNFDLIADAPGGVPKLRELILQMAVRGKLVPQDPKDEPAGKDLKEIAEPGTIPYAIPRGWRWTTLRSISRDLGQKVPDKRFTYIDVSAIDKDRGRIGEDPQIINANDAPSRARKIVHAGTVIYSTIRPYLLNIAVVDREFDPDPIVSTAFFVMHPFTCVVNRYLFYYLRSQPFTEYVSNAMTGMAYPAVNDSTMSVAPFPLPPLPEQKRIVAKVDELMNRCDELESRQRDRAAHHKTLVASCLNAVADPLKPNPNFIIHNSSFNLIFTSLESIAELRKTILQLAVQGRLVPQDSHAQKAGNEQEATSANLPSGWKQVLFSEIAETTGGVTKGRKLTGATVTYPYLRVANVQRGSLDLSNIKEIEISASELKRYALSAGDLLITEGGDWDKVGRMAMWRGEISPCLHQNHVFRARLISRSVCHEWVLMYFNSAAREYFARASKQTTNLASINMRQLRACPVRVPPLAEQKRIVSKVNEFMALCDALEAKLTQSSLVAEKLVGAVINYFSA